VPFATLLIGPSSPPAVGLASACVLRLEGLYLAWRLLAFGFVVVRRS